MDGPITPGALGWLYDFQNMIAGVLALGAGVLAYLAGKHPAKVARSIAEQEIKSAADLQAVERQDRAELLVNTAANIASQIQIEAAILQKFIEMAIPELDRVAEFKAAGKKPVAENVTYRIEKIGRFLDNVWSRLEPIPVTVSGPVGRLVVWLDDLTMRCADFRTTLESDGTMPLDIWKNELQEIVAGFDDLNRAITDFFAEPSVDPAESLAKYQAARMEYVKSYQALPKSGKGRNSP
jgi:hypothetical protein